MDANTPIEVTIEGEDDAEPITLLSAADVSLPFDANLVAALPASARTALAGEVQTLVEEDDAARADWLETAKQGLRLLGLKFEKVTSPWDGACGVVHPVLSAAVTSFQSRAIKNLFPASGPAKAKIKGKTTPLKLNVATRAIADLNGILTGTSDYRCELEKALFNCALMGAGFVKTWWSPEHNRPLSYNVPPEHLVMSPDATDVTNALRVTHIMRKHAFEIRQLQVAGFYFDPEDTDDVTPEHDIMEVMLGEGVVHAGAMDIAPDPTEELSKRARRAVRELDASATSHRPDDVTEEKSGISGIDVTKDSRHVLYETQMRLVLSQYDPDFASEDDPNGVPLPYVVTLDTETGELLALRRNWEESDPQRKPRSHFTQYAYMVSDISSYGLGLVHTIGQMADGATGMLRALIDAGTLATMQAGFKTRSLRIRDENTPLKPGEFRDVDVAAGKIQDGVYPLNFKDPSPTLLNLLTATVEQAQQIAAMPTSGVDSLPHNAASFAVLALVEKEMEPQAAVFTRLHGSLGHQLGLIAALARDHMAPTYEYDVDGDGQPGSADPQATRVSDLSFIDVVPVSNPNEATAGQKMMKLQALKDLYAAMPNQFDQAKIAQASVALLGEPEFMDLLKPQQSKPPMLDPVSENMRLLTGGPVEAYLEQDHDAHIRVHSMLLQDPRTQQMLQAAGPAAQPIMAALQAHMAQHLAMRQRRDIERELGMPLPPPDQPLPPQVEAQLSALAAEAADRVVAEQVAKAQGEQASDPVLQLQMRDADREDARAKAEIEDKQAQRLLDAIKLANDAAAKGVQLDLDAAKSVMQHMQQKSQQAQQAQQAPSNEQPQPPSQ